MNSYKETAQNENVAYPQLEPQMGFQYNQQFLPELAAPLTALQQVQQLVPSITVTEDGKVSVKFIRKTSDQTAMHQQQQRVQPVVPDFGSQLPTRDCISGPTITVTEDGKAPVAFPRKTRDRIKFTDFQLMALENLYRKEAFITKEERKVISEEINIDEVKIKIWFQNRRSKTRAELKRRERGLAKIRGRWMTKEVSSALIDNKTTNQAEQNFEWVSVPRMEEQTATTGAPVCYTWNTFPPIVEGQTELSSNFEGALHGYVQTGTAPAPENYTRHELPQMIAGQVDMETVLPETKKNPKKLDDLNEIVDRAAAVLDFKVPSHFEGVAQTPFLTAPNDMDYDPSIDSMIALGCFGVV